MSDDLKFDNFVKLLIIKIYSNTASYVKSSVINRIINADSTQLQEMTEYKVALAIIQDNVKDMKETIDRLNKINNDDNNNNKEGDK